MQTQWRYTGCTHLFAGLFYNWRYLISQSNSNTRNGYSIWKKKTANKNKAIHFQSYLSPTAVAKALHDRINFLLKDLSELGAVLVHPGCFAIVQPGIVEHQPDVIHILPGILVLTCSQWNEWRHMVGTVELGWITFKTNGASLTAAAAQHCRLNTRASYFFFTRQKHDKPVSSFRLIVDRSMGFLTISK